MQKVARSHEHDETTLHIFYVIINGHISNHIFAVTTFECIIPKVTKELKFNGDGHPV